ncbi:unnamed protein product [Brassica oleracea var. botrytis]|nr:PREDICTED: CLAVATA3/ESR (CLE)-related protein 9-like [Brassica oleracea var. oleracea]XP_013721740.1 CLAVATA3/ESR (CLE)-related protein 9 [Brassica napus]VDD36903.1 unnamed protein product [Brassica oleracea]
MCIFCVALKHTFLFSLFLSSLKLYLLQERFLRTFLLSPSHQAMSPTYLKRPVMISLLLFVVVLLTASIASPTVEENRMTSRNVPYRTHPLVPRVHHPYYVTPQGSCDSFTRPYARSMCLELQRIHRSTTKQPLVYPPPPPPEIDPRYGVDKRLVPSGPNPLHN